MRTPHDWSESLLAIQLATRRLDEACSQKDWEFAREQCGAMLKALRGLLAWLVRQR